MSLFTKKIRKCYDCDNLPIVYFADIQLETLEGLKTIAKGGKYLTCRVGCCANFYQGNLWDLRAIVNKWNAHTRSDEKPQT